MHAYASWEPSQMHLFLASGGRVSGRHSWRHGPGTVCFGCDDACVVWMFYPRLGTNTSAGPKRSKELEGAWKDRWVILLLLQGMFLHCRRAGAVCGVTNQLPEASKELRMSHLRLSPGHAAQLKLNTHSCMFLTTSV
eukprot:1160202-Pelagomonas_calceolata.AAC.8